MAMECEVSWLHHKWEGIKGFVNFTQITDSELDEHLRRLGNIADKLEKVATLIYPLGLETFVASQADLYDTIRNDFPDLLLGQLAISFQQALFWRRNRILHLADTSFDEAVASRCFKLAVLGIHIFQQLDLEARKGV